MKPDRPDEKAAEAGPGESDALVSGVKLRAERRRRWLREGEPSTARQLAQIGVLGWIVVAPTLAGLFLGRLVDHAMQTGILWTAPAMMAGVMLGCWFAWRWMNAP